MLVHVCGIHESLSSELFFYHGGDRRDVSQDKRVSLMIRDGKVWLNQSQISDLFGTSVQNVSYHIINIMKEKELDANSVIKDYLITASDGKKYNVIYYSLEMILAIGYRVRSIRGVQFRQWATRHLSEYLVKGFTMDDDRLKNSDGRPDYRLVVAPHVGAFANVMFCVFVIMLLVWDFCFQNER